MARAAVGCIASGDDGAPICEVTCVQSLVEPAAVSSSRSALRIAMMRSAITW